jgi:hypothetical protein
MRYCLSKPTTARHVYSLVRVALLALTMRRPLQQQYQWNFTNKPAHKLLWVLKDQLLTVRARASRSVPSAELPFSAYTGTRRQSRTSDHRHPWRSSAATGGTTRSRYGPRRTRLHYSPTSCSARLQSGSSCSRRSRRQRRPCCGEGLKSKYAHTGSPTCLTYTYRVEDSTKCMWMCEKSRRLLAGLGSQEG